MRKTIDNRANNRDIGLGQIRVEADMLRGEVFAECVRGVGRLIERVRRRAQATA